MIAGYCFSLQYNLTNILLAYVVQQHIQHVYECIVGMLCCASTDLYCFTNDLTVTLMQI